MHMLSLFAALAGCEYYVQDSILYVNNVTEVKRDEIAELVGQFTKAIVDENAKIIGLSAFKECPKLTEVELKGTIEYIMRKAFYNCENLQKVNVGPGLTHIEEMAFYNTKISELVFDDSLKVIESDCFSEFVMLQNVTFPNSLESLGSNVFMNCTNLMSVKFGDSLSEIKEYSFAGCSNLKEIVFGNNLTSILDYAFSSTGLSGNFEMGANIVNIGNHSFENTKINGLILNENIQLIGEYAFSSKSLICVFFKGSTAPLKISQKAFEGSGVIKVMTFLNYTDKVFGNFDVFAGSDLETCFDYKGENTKKRAIIICSVSLVFVAIIIIFIVFRLKTNNNDPGNRSNYEEILKYNEIQ